MNLIFTPETIAYMLVQVPARDDGSVTMDDALRIVDRYLYGGFEITDKSTVGDTHYVQVRCTTQQNRSVTERLVQQQRDRLASGLYRTSDAKYLVQED